MFVNGLLSGACDGVLRGESQLPAINLVAADKALRDARMNRRNPLDVLSGDLDRLRSLVSSDLSTSEAIHAG